MAVNDSGGCISSGAQGKVCLVRGWDAAKIHVNRLNGLVELQGGGLCLEVHRITLSDAIHMCLRRRHPLALLALMFIPRRDVG